MNERQVGKSSGEEIPVDFRNKHGQLTRVGPLRCEPSIVAWYTIRLTAYLLPVNTNSKHIPRDIFERRPNKGRGNRFHAGDSGGGHE